MGLDLSASYQSHIADALKLAQLRERGGHFKEAAQYYREVAQVYVDFARETKNESLKKQRADLARSYLEKAKGLESRKTGESPKMFQGDEVRKARDSTQNQNETEREALAKQIDSLVTKVSVTWSEIAGLEDVKTQIRSLYGIKLAKTPDNVRLDQNLNLLLYGPPGTGKTLLASAVSNSIEATFYSANASDLVSKWLGESSRLVATLFEQARDHSPAVIFIDEFDSLVGSREKSDSQSEARILGSILSELDGVSSRLAEDKLVIVIAATNVPWKLDRATLSRFSGGQIYVPLPDTQSRIRILELNLSERGLESCVQFLALAQITEGYSGREISSICNTASRMMINRLNPDIELEVDGGLDRIREYKLDIGPINEQEFRHAVNGVKPAVDADYIAKYQTWGSTQ